jgi:hypothetical protein
MSCKDFKSFKCPDCGEVGNHLGRNCNNQYIVPRGTTTAIRLDLSKLPILMPKPSAAAAAAVTSDEQ